MINILNDMKIPRLIKSILFILSFMFLYSAFGQEVKVKKKEFRNQPPGFEEAWKAVREGVKKFDEGPASYKAAREYFLKAYTYNDKNAALNYLIGMSYLYADQKHEAAKYFAKALELNPNVSGYIHYRLARAYHIRLEFDNAIKEYTLFKNSLEPKVYKKLNINIDKYIEECLNGKEIVKNPLRVIISSLGTGVNSEFDDYGSIVNDTDTLMYYTSRRQLEKSKPIVYDHKFPEKIYMSVKKEDKWSEGKIQDKQFTSKNDNDAVVAFNKTISRIYTYYGRKGPGDIYGMDDNKEKKKWKKKRLGAIDSKYAETSVAVTPKEDTVYYISAYRSKKNGSLGGKDIFMITKDKEGKWTKPVNMGSTLNTQYDEEALYLHPDGSKLYFSSEGHNSMGGFDIFVSKRDENGKWGKPENLGYPINTSDDDLFFVMNRSNKYAYYSANREGSVGEKDIFKIVYLGKEKEPVLVYDKDMIAYFKYDKPNIMRKPVELLSIDSSVVMMGRIIDQKSNEPVKDNPAKMNLIDSDKSQIVGSVASDAQGNYKINVPIKKKYAVEIAFQGYLCVLESIVLSAEKLDIIPRDFTIKKIEVGEKVVLKNIFFETAKTTLLASSFEELNKVLKLLSDNPKLRLEISGHTDNQGQLQYNTKLSEGRAKAVVDWLVEKGIDAGRLEFKGYAFTQPIADNKTKEGRAQNRRVEFKVLGIE